MIQNLPAFSAAETAGRACKGLAYAESKLRTYSRRVLAAMAAARAGSTYPALLFGIGPAYAQYVLEFHAALLGICLPCAQPKVEGLMALVTAGLSKLIALRDMLGIC